MKKNGSKKHRIGIVIGLLALLIVSGMLANIGYQGSPSPVNTVANTPQVLNGTAPGINSTLYAYIYGIPTATNPFGGFSIPNETSAMPPAMDVVVHGYGASTVQILWSGSRSPISSDFSWTATIPFDPGRGTFTVEINILSTVLKASQTFTYVLNVMNYTQYISYENAQNPVKSLVLEPWYVQYEAAEAATFLSAVMITVFYFYSQIQWENTERKQKLFDIE